MARTDGTYRPGVSIHEAAVMLGVSPTTVRRWVASGRLRSERHARPQGAVVRVFLGPEQVQPETVVREQVPTVQVPTDAPPRAAEDVPPALTAWLSAILAPILAELSVSRQQLVSQAETIGRQAAELERAASIAVKLSDELEAARAQISPLVVSTATEPPDPTTKPFWSRWRTSAPWLLLAVILLLAVVLLGWLR